MGSHVALSHPYFRRIIQVKHSSWCWRFNQKWDFMCSFLNSGWQNINLIDTDCSCRFGFINQNALQRLVGRWHQWTQEISTQIGSQSALKNTLSLLGDADIDRNQLIEEDKRYRREVAKKNAAKAGKLFEDKTRVEMDRNGWISLLEMRHEKSAWFPIRDGFVRFCLVF